MKRKPYYPQEICSIVLCITIVACTFLLPWVKVGEKWYGLIELLVKLIQRGDALLFFQEKVDFLSLEEMITGSDGIGISLLLVVAGYCFSAVVALLYVYYLIQLLKHGGEDSYIIWIWIWAMALTWGFWNYQRVNQDILYEYIVPFPGQILIGLLIICEFLASRGLYEQWENERSRREQEHMQQLRSDLMEKNYHEILELTQKSRMVYHDFKNDINILRQYAANNQIEKLKKYLDEIATPVFTLESFIWTGIEMIDLILNQKSREAKEKQIEFQVEAERLNSSPLSDKEICSVFGNLLDNALEACGRMQAKTPWIQVSIKKRGQIFQIRVANTMEQQPKKRGTRFLSHKLEQEAHGIGLQSVEAIVKQREGNMEIEYSSDLFEVWLTFFGDDF